MVPLTLLSAGRALENPHHEEEKARHHAGSLHSAGMLGRSSPPLQATEGT